MRLRGALLLALAALCAAGAGFWLARELDRPAPQLTAGTWLARPKAPAAFSLIDGAGRSFTAGDLVGHPSLMFFGFTHCPDVCPTTMALLAQVAHAAPVRGLRVIFVSVDPGRDTPALVGGYVHAFDPAFVGLTGSEAAIRTMARDYGVAVNKVELPGGDYTMDHSAVVFLLDAHGRTTAVFTPPFDAAAMTADLQRAAPWLDGRT